jgi:hypothetical protein
MSSLKIFQTPTSLSSDRSVVRHKVQSSSRPSGRTRSISGREACRSRRLAARRAFALRRDIVRHEAVNALFAWLLGDERQAELFAHDPGQEAVDRVGLAQPVGCLHDGRDGRTSFAAERREHKGPFGGRPARRPSLRGTLFAGSSVLRIDRVREVRHQFLGARRQPPSSSGRKASSAGMVCNSLR